MRAPAWGEEGGGLPMDIRVFAEQQAGSCIAPGVGQGEPEHVGSVGGSESVSPPLTFGPVGVHTDLGNVHVKALAELRNLLMKCACATSADELTQFLMQGAFKSKCVLQLGLTILQLLLYSPADGIEISQAFCGLKNGATPFRRDRDLLPLPVPPIGAVVKLYGSLPVTPEGLLQWDPKAFKNMGKQQRGKLIRSAAFQLWRLLSVVVLNGEYMGWRPPLFSDREFPGHASQQVAFEHVEQLCNYFTRDPLSEKAGLEPEKILLSKGVDYTGEDVLHALPLKVGELLPGLPADGVAGKLEAAKIANDEVVCWVMDPELALLPRDRWPSPLPRAGMNCSRDEWLALVPILIRKGILAPIAREEILKVEAELLLNGAFAVIKKGVAAPGEDKVTRLIMNMAATPYKSSCLVTSAPLPVHRNGCRPILDMIRCYCGPVMINEGHSMLGHCQKLGESTWLSCGRCLATLLGCRT